MKRPEIPYSRVAELKARAGTVLRKYSCSVPVDPLETIQKVGEFELYYEDLDECVEAAIEYDEADDKYHLYVDTTAAARDPNRARFTLAHELGHYFITEHMDALSRRQVPRYRFPVPSASSDYVELLAELEADCFARHLLVPDEALQAELDSDAKAGSRVSAGLVRHLAKRFQVSFQCAAGRLLEKTGDACALIVHPKAPLRVPWVEVSDQFNRRFGLTRNSRLRHPQRRNGGIGFETLEHWFAGVRPSARNQLISAHVDESEHDVVAFLAASPRLP